MIENGIKKDDGKLIWSLLPFDALEEIVKVYTYGAKKYGEYNYLGGIRFSRIVSAIFRHFKSWWIDKEEYDKESGCLHLAHMAWGILTLIVYTLRKIDCDDRI